MKDSKQSETLEERVIEEFNKEFYNLCEEAYPDVLENRQEQVKDFILKSLQQVKLEYKEELLKKLINASYGFDLTTSEIIKIINEI